MGRFEAARRDAAQAGRGHWSGPAIESVSRSSQTRTYAEALEALGGQPWRTLDGTEQWFLVEEPDPSEPRRDEPDTDAFRIPRPSNRWWMAIRAAAIAGGMS